jgi:hypothetical protein
MNCSDPCAAEPLSFEELRSLGVFSLNETPPDSVPGRGRPPVVPPMDGARDAFVACSFARSEAQHFPENRVQKL